MLSEISLKSLSKEAKKLPVLALGKARAHSTAAGYRTERRRVESCNANAKVKVIAVECPYSVLNESVLFEQFFVLGESLQ